MRKVEEEGEGRREGREGVVVEGSVLFNRMNHLASTTHLNTHLELIKAGENMKRGEI